MRLLFYIPNLSGGGAERVLTVLANNLVAKGHFIRVVYTGLVGEGKDAYHLDSRVEEVRIFRRQKKQTLLGRIVTSIYLRLFKYIRIRKQVYIFKPDVAISFLTSLNNDVIVSLWGTHIPLIVSEHSKFSRYYGLRTNLCRKILYPFANVITVLTEKDYNIYKNRYRQIVYMPNPCECKICETPTYMRERVVLAAGRVNQWEIKGFDTLIKCWNKLQVDFPDWKCVIAGDYTDDAINRLQDSIPEGAIDKVKFLGFRSDLESLMEKSRVFCLTSRIEGFSMVLVEAMKKSCCCISFDVENGPNEIIEDKVSGLLVKNQSLIDLEEKLRRVMQDEKLCSSLSKNAPKSVEKYSVDKIVMMWEELFQNVTYKKG